MPLASSDLAGLQIAALAIIAVINVLMVVRFFQIAADVKRLADKLAPKDSIKPVKQPLSEQQRQILLPEFQDQ